MIQTGIMHNDAAYPIHLGSRIVEDIESIVYANDVNGRRQQDFK